jgi:hypothetical protein
MPPNSAGSGLSQTADRSAQYRFLALKFRLQEYPQAVSNWPENAIPAEFISLTTKPGLVIRISIVCVNGRFNILGAAEIDTNPPRSIHLFIGFHAWDK